MPMRPSLRPKPADALAVLAVVALAGALLLLTWGQETGGALTAEIGEVITSAASGRTGAEDITLFDSTGIALQDIACSCALLTAAEKAGLGTAVEL